MDRQTSTFDPRAPLFAPPEPWAGSTQPSARPGPPYHMTNMIAAEPYLARRILDRLLAPGSPAAQLAIAVREAAERGHPIVVTGCGTSEHGALATVEVLREGLRAAGLPWRLGHAGCPVAVQAFEGSLEDWLGAAGGVVIGVSHEGGNWATNLALEQARASGATVALLTASDRSPGAALADIVVTTEEQDQSWCHTIGYLSAILAAMAVAGHVVGSAPDAGAARALLAAGLTADAIEATERLAGNLAGVERLIVVATGADRPAARELVLKVEEGAHLPAAMRDLETLLHGHLAGIDARTGLVLIFTEASQTDARAARAAGVLRAVTALGVTTGAILGVSHGAAIPASLTPAGRLIVPAAPNLPPTAASLLGSAVPLQLLTERLARERGVDPDPIRRDDPAYLAAADAAG